MTTLVLGPDVETPCRPALPNSSNRTGPFEAYKQRIWLPALICPKTLVTGRSSYVLGVSGRRDVHDAVLTFQGDSARTTVASIG